MIVSNGVMPQAAASCNDENEIIGIQPYAEVWYPKDVKYVNAPKMNRDTPVERADVTSNDFLPSLSTKLKKHDEGIEIAERNFKTKTLTMWNSKHQRIGLHQRKLQQR